MEKHKVVFKSKTFIEDASKKKGVWYVGGKLGDEKFGPGAEIKYKTETVKLRGKQRSRLVEVIAEKGTYNDERFYDGWRDTFNKKSRAYTIERVYRGKPLFTVQMMMLKAQKEVLLEGGTEEDNDYFDQALTENDPELKKAFMDCMQLKNQVQGISDDVNAMLKTTRIVIDDKHEFKRLVGTTEEEGTYGIWFQ